MSENKVVRKDKYQARDSVYFGFTDKVRNNEFYEDVVQDLVYNFPVYAGHVNIARLLTFYEIYKQTMNVSGHIADLGTWKGYSLFTWSSLTEIFEPNGNTDVYGFDNGKGMLQNGAIKYSFDFDNVQNIIDEKGIKNTYMVDMDLSDPKAIEAHFEKNPFMKFKLVFMDIGVPEVLRAALPIFWKNMSPGGILVMDHYNSEICHEESNIALEVTEGRNVHCIPWNRNPTAYIIK